jgi:hypothetical protein
MDTPTNSVETQVFITAGAYKRANPCCGDVISWGVVWDYMNDRRFGEYTDNASLHQIRYILGYALNDCDEVGLWGAFGLNDDQGQYYDPQEHYGVVVIQPMDQYNLYWRRSWKLGAETMVYAGLADDRYKQGQWIVGFNGRVPLSCHTSLFGSVHYILPSTSAGDTDPNGIDDSFAEETWNVSFGVIWTFGPGCCRRNAPLLPVADNGTFSVAGPADAIYVANG